MSCLYSLEWAFAILVSLLCFSVFFFIVLRHTKPHDIVCEHHDNDLLKKAIAANLPNCQYNQGSKVVDKIIQFTEDYHIDKKIIVSLSGGVDSMVMCYILKSLDINVYAIHLNYRNRKESDLGNLLLSLFIYLILIIHRLTFTHSHIHIHPNRTTCSSRVLR